MGTRLHLQLTDCLPTYRTEEQLAKGCWPGRYLREQLGQLTDRLPTYRTEEQLGLLGGIAIINTGKVPRYTHVPCYVRTMQFCTC